VQMNEDSGGDDCGGNDRSVYPGGAAPATEPGCAPRPFRTGQLSHRNYHLLVVITVCALSPV
jgi:hypothetical protein